MVFSPLFWLRRKQFVDLDAKVDAVSRNLDEDEARIRALSDLIHHDWDHVRDEWDTDTPNYPDLAQRVWYKVSLAPDETHRGAFLKSD